MSKAEYAKFEATIRGFCEERGADLLTFGYWRDNQDDADWQATLLGADIAIECKALGRRYTEYQLQKPATKLQNYLALGLPVVCDSVPSYIEIGEKASVLFADSIEAWQESLSRLFESRELRAKMSASGRKAVESHGIAANSRNHVTCFEEMLARGS
jgi:glycosyltransferase involved in cell wall biosynthesis